MIYTGIGSRETPDSICDLMITIANQLAEKGYMLQSGHAGGADLAFETGCIRANGTKRIYIPWKGFNNAPNHPDYIVPEFTSELMEYAASFHPAWNKCSSGAQKMHARNVWQINNSEAVICWTPRASGSGGTGQAIRIARANNIPVFDLADPSQQAQLIKLIS